MYLLRQNNDKDRNPLYIDYSNHISTELCANTCKNSIRVTPHIHQVK